MTIVAGVKWQVSCLHYRGKPIVAVITDSFDPHYKIQTVTTASLQAGFSRFGFKIIDQDLNNVPQTSAKAVLTRAGLVVDFAHTAHFPGGPLPTKEWMEHVKGFGSCVVLLLTGEATGGSTSHAVRKELKRRRCLGISASVVDVRPENTQNSSRYRLITKNGDYEYLPHATHTVLLDSNVLLDFEKAAQGKIDASSPGYQNLVALAQDLAYQDVLSGFAIAELCWSTRDRRPRSDREESLLATVDAWLGHGADEITNPAEVHLRWQKSLLERETDVSGVIDPTPLTFGIYPALLKLFLLARQIEGFKARQRMALYEEYCRWVAHDLKLISAYALQVASDLLVGSPKASRYTRQLLKFSKDPLRDLRGAAWDLTLLTMSDLMVSGKLANRGHLPIAVATADKAMASLRKNLHFAAFVQHETLGTRGLLQSQINVDPRLKHYRSKIEELNNELKKVANLRFATPKTNQFLTLDEIDQLVMEMEPHISPGPSRTDY